MVYFTYMYSPRMIKILVNMLYNGYIALKINLEIHNYMNLILVWLFGNIDCLYINIFQVFKILHIE